MQSPRQASSPHRLLTLAATLALFLSQALPAAAQERVERWYRVEMMGQKAGWMHEVVETTDQTITSTSRSRMELARGALKISIEMDSTFVETPDGKPLSMRSRQILGAGEVIQDFTFADDGITHVTTQGGKRTERKAERPAGEWLTPAAGKSFFAQRFKANAADITLRTIDPQAGLTPVTSKYTNFTPAKIKVGDREIDARKCDVEVSITPGVKSSEFLDSEGTVVRSETLMGGLSVVMVLSNAEEAAGEVIAPEIMVNTFVKPDKTISRARQSTRAVFVVSDPEALPDLPSTGAQSVERIDAKSARITVTRSSTAPAPAADSTDPAFTTASTMIDSNDEKIRSLATRALENAADKPAAERAELLRRFAHSYIRSKNLGVGFASASEVAQNRSGDCSEHGVFTAALLRAAGIPSRVASGLIYADAFAGSQDIFGYHMWTQALIEVDGQPRWIDLDATLPNDTPFDATHITLSVSALPEGELSSSMASMAATLGRLTIKVESVSHAPAKAPE
jgi:hypothetical protein